MDDIRCIVRMLKRTFVSILAICLFVLGAYMFVWWGIYGGCKELLQASDFFGVLSGSVRVFILSWLVGAACMLLAFPIASMAYDDD